MPLPTPAQCARLLANSQANAARNAAGQAPHDFVPVVKLFTPNAGATWLLTELHPEDKVMAFGLCDLGLGAPQLGSVSRAELAQMRGRPGLPPEGDRHFRADKPLSAYAAAARANGAIVVCGADVQSSSFHATQEMSLKATSSFTPAAQLLHRLLRRRISAMVKAAPSKTKASAPEADLAAVDTDQRATLEKNLKDSRSAFSGWESAQIRTDQQLYVAIGRLAEFAAAVGNDYQALTAFAAEKGVRATKASTPYTVVAKLVTDDRKKASKYAMVLQLAERHSVERTADSVVGFIKTEGGIEACLRHFRDLQREANAAKRGGRPSAFDRAVERISGLGRIKAPKDLQLASVSEDYFLIVGVRNADGLMQLLQDPVTDAQLVHKAVAAMTPKA